MVLDYKTVFISASFGGIFGLCLGGSLISVVELFYYLLLSLYHTFRTPNKIKPKVNVNKLQALEDIKFIRM